MVHIKKEKIFFLTKSELINYIKKNFHSEIMKLFVNIEKLYDKIDDSFIESNYSLLKELLKQFKLELSKHVKREHEKYFEFLLNIKKGGIYDIELFEKIISVEDAEHMELKTYISGIINILEKLHIEKDNVNNDYSLLIEKINELYDLILKTIVHEDYLIEKVRKEFLEIKEK